MLVIPLELQEKSICHLLWHSLPLYEALFFCGKDSSPPCPAYFLRRTEGRQPPHEAPHSADLHEPSRKPSPPLRYPFPSIPRFKKRVYCGKEYCYTCGERASAHGGKMNTSIPCYGIIPARYDSSRFPGKPLADIWGRPMFWHVYAHAKRASVLRDIVLATDDERIAEAALTIRKIRTPVVPRRAKSPKGSRRSLPT